MAPDLHEHPDGERAVGVVLPRYAAGGVCLTDFGPDPVVAAGGAARTGEQRQIEAIASCPPGPELGAWLRGLDLGVLPAAVVVEVVAAWDRMESWACAGKLAAVAELAVREEMDPGAPVGSGDRVGSARVVAFEVGARLRWAQLTAQRVVRRAVQLDGLLIATGAALAAGHVDSRKAGYLADRAQDLSHQAALAVEDAVLPDAGQCSGRQFEQRVEHAIRLVDAEGAAARHALAREGRRVSRPRARAEGMAAMWCVLPAPDATALDGVLDHTARTARALGDPRTVEQLRADALRDLVVGDVPAVEGPAFEARLDPPPPPAPHVARDGRDGPWITTIGQPVHPRPIAPDPTARVIPIPAPAAAPAAAGIEVDTATAPAAETATTAEAANRTANTDTTADNDPRTATGTAGAGTGDAGRTATGTGDAGTGGAGTDDVSTDDVSADGSSTTDVDTSAPATDAPAADAPATDAAGVDPQAPDPALVAAAHRNRTSAGLGCETCGGRRGAQVRVTIAASTLLGLDDQPGDLDGFGPIDALTARALAAGGVWQRIVTDPLTDQPLDVGRRRYRPPAALDEHVRVRDKTCAAPGCTIPATHADLDHAIAYRPQPGDPPGTPLGGTDANNLGPLCRTHHRLKTTGGFRLRQIEPGLFEWTTPTGHRYLVRPGTGRSLHTTTHPHHDPPPF